MNIEFNVLFKITKKKVCKICTHCCLVLFYLPKDRQGNYNVILGRVHVTIFAVGSKRYYIFLVCSYRLSYPALKSAFAVLYCHMWSVWPYRIFPHYLKCGTIFGQVIQHKIRFWFRVQIFIWNVYQFKDNSARLYRKCT